MLISCTILDGLDPMRRPDCICKPNNGLLNIDCVTEFGKLVALQSVNLPPAAK
uniref:Uncharacterized protein n=1 Tax=Babesia bovis TaxID=5865 RepID=S6AZ75_BABBO|nr:hypothetical protein [Babesia bovis]